MAITKPQVSTRTDNKLQIIGDNILYNNGIITAFYILPTTNYSTSSPDGIVRAIRELTSLMSGLAGQRPNLEFSIERIDKIIRAKDVKSNLIETIKMYREDFDMPPEFSYNLRDDSQSYSILGIDIQQTDIANVEDNSILETAKQLFKRAVAGLTGLGNLNVNAEKLIDIEKNIYGAIRHKCARASRELVFYTYVSKVYPCYEISYDQLSFINENNFENIMGAVSQTVSDNFGWFEMHNDGVDIFDLPQQSTYGCMVDIKNFPLKINSSCFPMDYDGCVTTIKCLKKEEASIKLKRTRAEDKYEMEQAVEFGQAQEEALDELAESVAIASYALGEIEKGETFCQFNCSILVTGNDREELKTRVARLFADCKDRDILASKSLTQAADFLDNYIHRKPKKYEHFAALQFPLSFQQNQGSIVGDSGTGIFSPAIGEDLQ